MTIDAKHETKNFVISWVAVILTIFVFEIALFTGVLYQLAKLTDKIRIQLGLIPENILANFIGGYSYSIVPVNITVFIIFSLVFGFFAFKMISKRGTKYSGWIYGIYMTIIFLLISSIAVTLSGDPFNWLCVMVGFPITFFIQGLLATLLLKKS